MKPAAPPVLRPTRLLDQLREQIHYKDYSLSTEQTYVELVRIFVKWLGLRHPRRMGRQEVEVLVMWGTSGGCRLPRTTKC